MDVFGTPQRPISYLHSLEKVNLIHFGELASPSIKSMYAVPVRKRAIPDPTAARVLRVELSGNRARTMAQRSNEPKPAMVAPYTLYDEEMNERKFVVSFMCNKNYLRRIFFLGSSTAAK